ncbi:MAG: HlyD family secretion protein [bacterium]
MTPRNFLLSVLVALLVLTSCQKSENQTAQVEQGTLHATITETGELQAVNSKIITVPFFNWEYGKAKIVWLEKEGIQVKKGHLVAQLDTSNVKRVKDQKQADLDMAVADLEKLKVEHADQIHKLEGELESAEAALKQAQIDTQRVKFESPAKQEISRLRLKIAELMYEQNLNKLKHTRLIQKEELLIQHERIKQIQSAIKNAEHTINRFALRAPADGIVEYRRFRRRQGKIKVGDEFWPGRPLIGLPDLRKMKVLTSVNETDRSKIQTGQKVLVRMDAYPRIAFEGKITTISYTCHEKEEKSKIKVFDVEVLLKETDPILKPGMTVSCEIVVADLENAFFVKPQLIRERVSRKKSSFVSSRGTK